MPANELRTLSLITKRQRDAGVSWLGSKASLEEYEVAIWLQQRQEQYIYQADFRLFSGNTTKVDFEILRQAPLLVWFVQGDKWHQGMDERVNDREQELAVAGTGAIVVEIWGHAIRAYPGFPVPTDASFDTMMQAALRGQQTHTAWS